MYEYIDVIIRRGRFKTVQFDCIRVFHYPGAFLVGLFLRNISNENLGEFFQKFTIFEPFLGKNKCQTTIWASPQHNTHLVFITEEEEEEEE
jgi:hypothetical protein